MKKGDLVLIREDLKSRQYNGLFVNDEMLRHKGKNAVITCVDEIDGCFKLDVDSLYWWNKKMVTPLPFPRMMDVSDNKMFPDSGTYFREVILYEPRAKNPYIIIDYDGDVYGYKYARDIQTLNSTITGETKDLKPCPFCGGKAEIEVYNLSLETPRYRIRCLSDFCLLNLGGKFHKTEEKAIEIWNKRTEPDNPKEVESDLTTKMREITAGDWHVTGNFVVSDQNNGLTIAGTDSEEAKKTYGGYLICETVAPANGRLIAAAPMLLDALHRLSDAVSAATIDGVSSELKYAKEVLMKALFPYNWHK